MDSIEKLLAIESVRRLRATYFYALDTKDWVLMRSLFSEDAVYDVRKERVIALGQEPVELPPVEVAIAAGDQAVAVGAERIAELIRLATHTWVTVHHGHEPIIDIIGPDAATGIWPMFDYIDDGKSVLKGYGHYHEQYRRVNDRWLISYTTLTRLRLDGSHPWANIAS